MDVDLIRELGFGQQIKQKKLLLFTFDA